MTLKALKRFYLKHEGIILRILIAISFLGTITPQLDGPSIPMLVAIKQTFKELIDRQFKIFDVLRMLFIGYCLSLVYLLLFSYSTKRINTLLTVIALLLLLIPSLMILFFLFAIHIFYIPSLITIALFYLFIIRFAILLSRRLEAKSASINRT